MKTHLTAATFYFPLVCIALAVSLLQGPIFTHVNIDEVFSTGLSGILLLSGLAVLFIGAFLGQLYIYRQLIEIEPIFHKRIIASGIAILIFTPFIFLLDLPLIPSIIALSSYTLFFDLFLDTKQVSITWCIWWIIIIGAFLSLLIFNRINLQQDKCTLQTLLDLSLIHI